MSTVDNSGAANHSRESNDRAGADQLKRQPISPCSPSTRYMPIPTNSPTHRSP
jgi:hypothetical protein